MIVIRKAQDRGLTKTNWLTSYHTFSFADYYDPNWMGFSNLRVINDDTIEPGAGFGMHAHQDMEIITYVVAGELEHKDNMGTGSIIRPGEIQKMSAGTGVMHSEFNHSKKNLLHLLQIWIIPNKRGLTPNYEQKKIAKENNKFILIGSAKPDEKTIPIYQDVQLYVAYLDNNNTLTHSFKNGRNGWLQMIKGKINLNDKLLSAGDGAAITDENEIQVQCTQDAELLLFDLG